MPRLIPALALALCIVAAPPARAQELTRQAKIERILDLTGSQSTLNQIFDRFAASFDAQMKARFPNATEQQLAQTRDLRDKLIELMKERVTWDKMRPQLVKIYGDTFSDEEIDGLLAFFQSSAGRSYVTKLPALTQQIVAYSQEQVTALMPEIQRLAREAAQKK
jgi:hypothetical protein